jgi:hypothetical protein
VPLFRYNAFLLAASISQPQEFVTKVMKLPKNACEVRMKHNQVFLNLLTFSLGHRLGQCVTTPASSQMHRNRVGINLYIR